MKKVTERRTKLLASARFKKAHAAAVESRDERKKSTMCPDGLHNLRDPRFVHAGYLLREGGLLCEHCWRRKYAKPRAKATKTRPLTKIWLPKPGAAKKAVAS